MHNEETMSIHPGMRVHATRQIIEGDGSSGRGKVWWDHDDRVIPPDFVHAEGGELGVITAMCDDGRIEVLFDRSGSPTHVIRQEISVAHASDQPEMAAEDDIARHFPFIWGLLSEMRAAEMTRREPTVWLVPAHQGEPRTLCGKLVLFGLRELFGLSPVLDGDIFISVCDHSASPRLLSQFRPDFHYWAFPSQGWAGVIHVGAPAWVFSSIHLGQVPSGSRLVSTDPAEATACDLAHCYDVRNVACDGVTVSFSRWTS